MPLYLKNKIVFIHIPKTGGSSVEEVFVENGDNTVFFSDKFFVGSHSPQHSTYQELMEWNMIPTDFKVISVVRHPYERFVSEYNYRISHIKDSYTIEEFTEQFFTENKWDNHNLSCCKFLQGADAEIIRFENFKEDFKRVTGLEMNKHVLKSEKILKVEDLSTEVKQLIQDFWKEDFDKFNYAR